MLRRVFLPTALGLGLAACNAQAPARPKAVPPTAHWVGGPDGGVWLECDAGRRLALHCSVYNDQTGALEQQGTYANRGTMLSRDDIVAFDGQTLYIAGSKALVYTP